MPTPTHCRCGHPAEAHEHLWPGHDCRICRCSGFVAADPRDQPPTAALVAVLLDAFARR